MTLSIHDINVSEVTEPI